MSTRQYVDSSARRQMQLGEQLAAQKKICIASGQTWRCYVRDNCSFSRERADELIRIGLGILPIEDSRERKKKSQRRTRSTRRAPAPDVILQQIERSRDLSRKIIERWQVATPSKTEVEKTRTVIKEAIAVWEELLEMLPH